MQKRLLFTILIAIFLMACDANIEQVNDDVNEDITEETINDEDRSQPSSNGETENKNTDKADKQQKNEESDNETDDLSQLDVHYIDAGRSEEHTSELQSRGQLVCRLLLEKKQKKSNNVSSPNW